MVPITARFVSAVLAGLLLAGPALAQDFRQYFKKPETTQEFWDAMRFEVSVGKYDLAAQHLKGFIAKEPTDKELFDLEEKEGMSAFLQLLTIPEMRKDAGPLVERVSLAVHKALNEPARIQRYVKKLSASPEEHAYAIKELRRNGPNAVPYLINEMREMRTSAEHVPVLQAMIRLNKDVLPALVAALDMPDAALRAELLEVLRERRDPEVVPALWYFSTSPKQPEIVRRQATETLALLLSTEADKLTPARFALMRESERYYYHLVKFLDPTSISVWYWSPQANQLEVMPKLNVSQAEEYYGLRYARQALELDPTNQKAQVLFLSLVLEKGYERAGVDQPLEKGAPSARDLLRSVSPDLIDAVLERALFDRRTAVILGAVQALGDLSDIRSTRPRDSRVPALSRALSYPDRRVQMMAAQAVLRIPGPPPPQASGRVIDILRRALGAEAAPKVLVADPNMERAEAVGKGVQQSGFEPVVVHNGKDVFRKLADASDIEAIIVDSNIPEPSVTYLIAQLRADINSGMLPVFITVAPAGTGRVSEYRMQAMRRLADHYRNVWVIRATVDPEAIKARLLSKMTDELGKPLTETERKANANEAVAWLQRISAGEVKGYDIHPAEKAILRALQSEALRISAIAAVRGLSGIQPQRALAALMLDKTLAPEVRAAAAVELTKHIQQHGLVLAKDQIRGTRELLQSTEDPKLKAGLALVVGSMRPGAARTGARLQGYFPPPPMPAAEKEEKPKEEKKDDKKEDKKDN